MQRDVAFFNRDDFFSNRKFCRNYRIERENSLLYTKKNIHNGLTIFSKTESMCGSLLNSRAFVV